ARGSLRRSTRITRAPARASSIAAVQPARLAPTTTASQSARPDIIDLLEALRMTTSRSIDAALRIVRTRPYERYYVKRAPQWDLIRRPRVDRLPAAVQPVRPQALPRAVGRELLAGAAHDLLCRAGA